MVFHPPVAIVAKAGDAGKYKVGLPAWNMIVRGFMSGAYIAMGGALATVCSTGIAYSAAQITAGAVPGGFASAGMAQLILGAVFPVGLIITVLTGAELFTGDAMLAPMAAFIHKITWAQVLTLWVFVYIGNLIGSIFWAYLMANGPFVYLGRSGCRYDHRIRDKGNCHCRCQGKLCRYDGHVVSVPQRNRLQLSR